MSILSGDPEQGDGLSGQVTDNCKKVERPIVEVIRTLTNIRGQGANFNSKIFYTEIKTREDLNDFTKFYLASFDFIFGLQNIFL